MVGEAVWSCIRLIAESNRCGSLEPTHRIQALRARDGRRAAMVCACFKTSPIDAARAIETAFGGVCPLPAWNASTVATTANLLRCLAIDSPNSARQKHDDFD
jgi:hypothetical protein